MQPDFQKSSGARFSRLKIFYTPVKLFSQLNAIFSDEILIGTNIQKRNYVSLV